MNTFYISFGQVHVHSINGLTFDKDSLCEIQAENKEQARKKAFDVFGQKWGFLYTSEDVEPQYFPRGIVKLDGTRS